MAKPVRNATEAYITSKRPKTNRSNVSRLRVSSGGDGNTHRAFLFFSLPFPRGSSIISAKFRFYTEDASGGSVTFTVAQIGEKWKANKVSWDRQPSIVAGTAVGVNKPSGYGVNQVWEFDLKTMMQSVSTAGGWRGVRITVDTSAAKKIYSSLGPVAYRPELEVEWTDAPEPPEQLSPANGMAVPVPKPKLTFDFTDDAGNTEMNAAHIQISTVGGADSNFVTPTYDSGSTPGILTSVPEVDLATIAAAPSLSAGASAWWRVRVQDAAGLWSDWSDIEEYKYVTKGTLTITSPPSGTPSIVNDATPPILWSLTGRTQSAWQATVALASDPGAILWNSGKETSSVTGAAIPDKVITKDNVDYILTLMVWDTESRVKNGDHPIYTVATRTFRFQSSGTVAVVTNVQVAQDNPWPWINVTFNRSTAADEYNIWRDNDLIAANVPAADLTIGGTAYRYVDRLAAPRVPHTYEVQAVVNSVASNKVAAAAPITSRLIAPMMMERDGSNPVYFLNPNVDPQSMTFQEQHQPLNAPPVLITQYIGGYEGRVAGVFADDILPGVSARNMRNIFRKWKRHPNPPYLFYNIDEVMEIVPYDMHYRPRAKSEGVIYDVSFAFFEDD